MSLCKHEQNLRRHFCLVRMWKASIFWHHGICVFLSLRDFSRLLVLFRVFTVRIGISALFAHCVPYVSCSMLTWLAPSTRVVSSTENTQQTHSVATTLLQRRCNVTTLQRRCYDVVWTLCVCWVMTVCQIANLFWKKKAKKKKKKAS